MIKYIYFIKCPSCPECHDEHFELFDDAKARAMNFLSYKPTITQVETNRNDFDECTDSCDLGTVWSWEDMMQDVSADSELATFSKAETLNCDDDYFNCEFDDLQDTFDKVPDNFRKPVPTDMSIDDLVEAMEENEDTVECKKCNELFSKDSCTKDPESGWVCEGCRSTTLTETSGYDDKRSNSTSDSAGTSTWDSQPVELEYLNLTVTLQGPMRDVDDWDEEETFVPDYTYEADPNSVAEVLCDLMTDDDVADVPGGFDALEDEAVFNDFMNHNFDYLVEKYMDQLCAHFEKYAREEYEEGHSLYESHTSEEEPLEVLEEFDNDAHLTTCPECGSVRFDTEIGICLDCGFNVNA